MQKGNRSLFPYINIKKARRMAVSPLRKQGYDHLGGLFLIWSVLAHLKDELDVHPAQDKESRPLHDQ